MEEIQRSEQITLSEQILCRNVGEALERHYPGWLWMIYTQDGVVQIRSMRLHGKFGFVLKQEEIDNDYKAVVRAGGELLERFGLPRNAFNYDKWRQMPMSIDGNLIGDLAK